MHATNLIAGSIQLQPDCAIALAGVSVSGMNLAENWRSPTMSHGHFHRAPRCWALAAFLATIGWSASLHAQTQAEMNADAGRSYAQADEQMTIVYRDLFKSISPNGQVSLRDAQRAWLKFRDQECEFESLATKTGSIHPMIVAACLERLTKARTADLDAQLHCPQGDMSCGGQ